MNDNTHTHTHTQTQTQTQRERDTHTHTRTHTDTHTHTHARAHTHRHTRTHTRAHTRTHTHTHTRARVHLFSFFFLSEWWLPKLWLRLVYFALSQRSCVQNTTWFQEKLVNPVAFMVDFTGPPTGAAVCRKGAERVVEDSQLGAGRQQLLRQSYIMVLLM